MAIDNTNGRRRLDGGGDSVCNGLGLGFGEKVIDGRIFEIMEMY